MSERVVRVRGFKPLTGEQEKRIAELAESDAPIDYSDIPPLDEEFWRRAVRNPFYRPVKSQLTVRLDSDVLAWLKAKGRGYQTKINAILRRAMLEDASSK
jgi:uncharacterized protein (DUF4415 family)